MLGVRIRAGCCSQEPDGLNRRVSTILICLSFAASLTTAGPAGFAQGSTSPSAPQWSDSFVSRVEALALIQTLNAEILASTSATTTLEKWCRDHHLAENPQIVARRTTGAEQPPTTEQRERLQVTHDERVRHRRVELTCGNRVLSVADNWYVPSRLTKDMNRQLDTSDAPFGKVVRPLAPFRRTFAAKMLWQPLPEGWESRSTAAPQASWEKLEMPDALFEHKAVLYTSRNRPFAEVDELYQRGILAFPQPR
jgi:chorismate-pyruvate lyase